MRKKDKIRQKMKSTSMFTFSKSNQKVNIRIETRIRKKKMRVTSSEGKVSSPDCEVETVETRIEDDSGSVKVSHIDFGWFSIFRRQYVLIYNI